MIMLHELFKFPIVMIDGKSEEKKAAANRLLGKGSEDGYADDYDIIIGEVEYPYYDFIGIEDRWLPNKKSLARAMDGKFDACTVRFVNVGEILVPWNKKRFKEELQKFAIQYEASLPPKSNDRKEVKILTLSPDQYNDIVSDTKSDDNEQK